MHQTKADEGEITEMKRSKAVGVHAVKLALFREHPHEAMETQQGPGPLVLFEPGLCLRGCI
jgi:hypothetical protein